MERFAVQKAPCMHKNDGNDAVEIIDDDDGF